MEELNKFKAWFNKQSRLIQIILLLIPICGWVCELLIRWGNFLNKKEDGLLLVVAIVATLPLGQLLGWVDIVWCLVFNHMLLAE